MPAMADRGQGPETMPAWHVRRYGGPEVLALAQRPRPKPGPKDILVQLHATTVSSGDARIRAMRLPPGFGPLGRLALGFRRPRQPVLGGDFAGTVTEVGADVTAFAPGQAVMGMTGMALGCHATHCRLAQDKALAARPSALSWEQAASVIFGGTAALHFLRRANLAAGERLLVIGASGAVGSAMVQLAHHQGAHITAVTGPSNQALARELGAAASIDYTQTDITAGGPDYDVIADTVGATSFARCHHRLAEHGRFLAVAGGLADVLARRKGTKRPIAGPAPERREDVAHLADLVARGILQPVIDAIYPFERIPAAHERVDSGHKRGSVVVTLGAAG